ncbi:hypothetical protein NHF46_04395 [Arthrobacter alpinus]|nr:hypothetical protein [Arthrobacter alpinus]
MVIAVLLMLSLNSYIQRTSMGRAMRAIALDPKGSLLMGINVNKVITWTFFIGSALAGAAGVMAGAYYGKIDFLMGFIIGLKAFTAAVIGGIGNIKGPCSAACSWACWKPSGPSGWAENGAMCSPLRCSSPS